MPRKPRVLEDNRVYHVYNRRTDCQPLFRSRAAYDDFLALMEEGRDRYNVRICTFCAMETHYIEANPLAAGLVPRAELWPWSSLAERISGHRRILDDGP